jgi:deoxyinosine 3'endonuclease (endonuclease V)
VVLLEDYIPGFLAFRELGPTIELFNRLKKQRPELWPEVIMVDGNGILHKRQCGYASHLGVLLKTPAFGCGKTFFDVDGLHQSEVEEYLCKKLSHFGEYEIVKGKSGRTWCSAILSDVSENKHIYVSVGTKISLMSATKIALNLLKYEVPEPIRLADKITRKWIRGMSE